MSVPLMLPVSDMRRVDALKERIGAVTRAEVVRAALDLLERERDRTARLARWKRAVKLASPSSRLKLKEFRGLSRTRWAD